MDTGIIKITLECEMKNAEMAVDMEVETLIYCDICGRSEIDDFMNGDFTASIIKMHYDVEEELYFCEYCVKEANDLHRNCREDNNDG